MEEKMFDELLESLRQAKAIMKGKMKPGRVFKYNEPDVQAIRKKFNLSQADFATLLGVSIGTLRQWEQGRKKPGGPERLLLMVAAKHPEVIMDTHLFAESGEKAAVSRV
jgi:putative transcriptional regulator